MFLKLWYWSRTLHWLPWAIAVRRCSLITLFLELLHAQVSLCCYLSIFLSTHLRISDNWLRSVMQTVSRCYFHSFSFIGIPKIHQIPQILWRVVLTPRAAWYQVEWSPLRRYHRFWFRHSWTFTGSRFLASLWHGTLFSDRIRKKIAEIAARKHRDIHEIQHTKEMVPLTTCETSFV